MGATATASKVRGERLRFGSLPKPATSIEVPYARLRAELADLTEAEQVMVVVNHPAFDRIVGRKCRAVDRLRSATRGPKPHYSALTCEMVLLYQRVCGLETYKATRDRLTGDRAADARKLFNISRKLPGSRELKLRSGIPSEATISRHKARFGEDGRVRMYERLFRAMRDYHLENFEAMREEARTLTLDGSKIETHYTCPIVDPKTGEVINAERVTCQEGGYVTLKSGGNAQGWNSLSPTTLTGLPLETKTVPLNYGEKPAGAEVLQQLDREIGQYLDPDAVHVLIADGGFNSPIVRQSARAAGFVEQIHYASHAERSKANVARHDGRAYDIESYPNWTANGHRELSCKCGQGRVAKRISRKAGLLTIRSEGECATCGSISITAGLWRLSQTTGPRGTFVRCQPGERGQVDLSFGNPLTFNDRLAAVYGQKRFAHNEGFHGQLTTRFKLYKGKRWFKRTAQVRTETAMVFSIIHALAMEQRTRAAAADAALTAQLAAAVNGNGAQAPPG